MIRLDRHPDCARLSFHEERALPWIADNKGLSSNVNVAIVSRRKVDGPLLASCVRRASEVHDAPRTRFTMGPGGSWLRRELGADSHAISFAEFHADCKVRDDSLLTYVADFCNTPVAIDDPHWVRALLIHATDNAFILAISSPHIVSDAVSIRLLARDIWRDYAHRSEGLSADVSQPAYALRDFAGTQRAWGETRDFDNKLTALAAHVAAGIDRVTAESPARYAIPLAPARPSTSAKCTLTAELSRSLRAVADQYRVSIQNVLTASTALTIARLFERREFCFRLPFSNRVLPGTADIVGFLSNDVPVFVSVKPDQSVSAFIKALAKEAFITTTRFGAVPWSVLTERLGSSGAWPVGRNPFDDYIINVFPAVGDIEPLPGYRALTYPLALAAFTSNELKVWWEFVNDNVIATLKIGIDEVERAESEYVPALLDVLAQVARNPEGLVADCLTAQEAHHDRLGRLPA